ncbi:MAG: amidohydrolase family protein [Actinomycetota bacterium]|nr:amidohydrolase family protein [Actinomycetota bacterium]MDA3011323.1 amidohydrolase family protein [Actinomycetota bacterium]MDA3024187.1 amidohydrolase family protein [Actinomycetota bacterium]
MLDYVIRGGSIVDGTGRQAATGDIGVRDGVIVAVGSVDEPAREVIDADGALVTPGWIDVHTHYDGQVSWDDVLDPSAGNGATTVVMGNCGVGFAPVRPGNEKKLIELMEGVEDIPGTALHEGIEWGRWETFPEYLDYIAGRRYSLDIGAQIAHGALRYYVMGERGARNEDATPDDLTTMSKLVVEALAAGAAGFSTSRTIGHRALDGSPVPGTFAPDAEIDALAAAMRAAGRGVFEMIPAGTVGKLERLGGERFTPESELALMAEFSRRSGRPVTFTLVKSPDYDPETWRNILDMVVEANDTGARLFPQVSSRPIGLASGLSGYHAFQRRPTYMSIAHLPLAERAREMARPEIKAAILSESDVPVDQPGSMANMYNLFQMAAAMLYPLSDPVDYEPDPSEMLGARAARLGESVLSTLYDFLLEQEGSSMCALMGGPDVHESQEVLRSMLTHSETVTGLSDAGAHVTLICDATMPTTQLTFWARDRHKGEKIPLEYLVAKQTSRNADLYGYSDRGRLAPGLRADINVIDFDNLSVSPPKAFHDLPAGGTRLIQPVSGYLATFVHGRLTRRFDMDTGARPGTLARPGRS